MRKMAIISGSSSAAYVQLAAIVGYSKARSSARAAHLDPELLQLAVEVRALEPHGLGDAADVAAFLADVVLEIDALERVARIAQRQVERQVVRELARVDRLRQRALDVLQRDLLAERGLRERLHRRSGAAAGCRASRSCAARSARRSRTRAAALPSPRSSARARGWRYRARPRGARAGSARGSWCPTARA